MRNVEMCLPFIDPRLCAWVPPLFYKSLLQGEHSIVLFCHIAIIISTPPVVSTFMTFSLLVVENLMFGVLFLESIRMLEGNVNI